MRGDTVELAFPVSARIHLPTQWTSGAMVDGAMPLGARWPAVQPDGRLPPLVYPLVVIEDADGHGGCVAVAAPSAQELTGTDRGGGGSPLAVRRRRATAVVERTADGFRLTFASGSGEAPTVRPVASLAVAVADYQAWLRAVYGVRPVAERIAAGELPAWVPDVHLVFTFDLWRPSGEVAHTYTHLRDFIRELQALGVPPGVLFYTPGWCGPYDGGYPHYRPAPELGGRTALREAVNAAHDAGYRIMLHTLAWGADPYRPEFEQLAPLALRNFAGPDPDRWPPPIVHQHELQAPPLGEAVAPAPVDDPLRGPYGGWPGGGPREALDYDSGRRPVGPLGPAAWGWLLETAPVPRRCEAVLTLGGVRDAGHGIMRVTVNGRALATPAGWFLTHDAYTFPFTFLFDAGPNRMELECFGWPGNAGGVAGPPPALVGTWYRIAQAYDHPVTWTVPAVGMDTDSPAWHAAFLDQLAPTVEEFGIDAVHIDAAMLWRWDEQGFFAAVQRGLPPRTVFGTEVASTPGLGFFAFSQARPPPPPAVDGWRSARSDLPWQITGQYQRLYPHLCTSRGFVPVGSVCNVNPVAPSHSLEEVEQTRRQLAWCREQRVLPALRMNYRDYGLDSGTRRWLLEHKER
jgi:hypothetical protein